MYEYNFFIKILRYNVLRYNISVYNFFIPVLFILMIIHDRTHCIKIIMRTREYAEYPILSNSFLLSTG